MCRETVLLSGGFLDGRVAWGWARTTSERAPRRAAAGFWRVGGRVEGDQKLGKRLAHTSGRELAAGRTLRSLPGEALIVDGETGQPELGVGEQDEPGPAIRLLGVANARGGPVEGLLAEAVGVLQVEAVDVRPPDDGEIGRAGTSPPEPELFRDARLAWQALDLDQDERAADRRLGASAAPVRMVPALGMDAGPGAHADPSVLGVLLGVRRRRCPPGARVVARELPPVPARPTGARLAVGVGVEAPPAPQPAQHRDALAVQVDQLPGQLLRIVARVEHAQRDRPGRRPAPEQVPNLLGGDGV